MNICWVLFSVLSASPEPTLHTPEGAGALDKQLHIQLALEREDIEDRMPHIHFSLGTVQAWVPDTLPDWRWPHNNTARRKAAETKNFRRQWSFFCTKGCGGVHTEAATGPEGLVCSSPEFHGKSQAVANQRIGIYITTGSASFVGLLWWDGRFTRHMSHLRLWLHS